MHTRNPAAAVFAMAVALLITAGSTAGSAEAQDKAFRPLFDGESLTNWEGSSSLFRIEDGAIVAGTLAERIPENAFLCTVESFDDFELRFSARLVGPGDNGGVQFRSSRIPGHHEVSGYQADIGTVSADWFSEVIGRPVADNGTGRAPVWGSLYDESRRNRYIAAAAPEDVQPVLRSGDWNDLVVRAEGRRIRVWLNGLKTVDYLERDHVSNEGSVCLQIHSGAPAEVWHRDITIRELPTGSIAFDKQVLDETFYGEGATFGDLNNDGVNDIISGPYWYEGPDYARRRAYYEPRPYDPAGYSDNFFAHVYDFNADGENDIFIVGFPGRKATWYENPGPSSRDKYWPAHAVVDTVDNESPWWTDLDGDGQPELVYIYGGRYGWAGPDSAAPDKPWQFHPATPDNGWQRFTHGLGVGDVNGDGRNDILERAGWWEQPASLDGDPEWAFHSFAFSERGGAQMYAYDVDGDGDNDVITSLAAHDYGLTWYEQITSPDGATSGSQEPINFVRHEILPESDELDRYGVSFAELHALDLIDVDGDGVKDIVTGKRWWSHGAEGDPDLNPRAWLYWFRTVRYPATDDRPATVEFVPSVIDDDSGVGVQIVAGDINGDGKPDVVVGNKKGTRVLLQRR